MIRKRRIYLSQIETKLRTDVPVLFWDTCALVDIVRTPWRSGNILDIQKYEGIRDAIVAGRIQSVASQITESEFDHHYPHTENETNINQRKAKDECKKYASFMADENVVNDINTSIDQIDVIPRLRSLTEDICRNTTTIAINDKQRRIAEFRLRSKIAPAAKKGEYKDCVIWTCYMKMAQRLARSGGTFSIFFTSNTKDFKENTPGQLANDCSVMSGNLDFTIDAIYGKFHRLGLV